MPKKMDAAYYREYRQKRKEQARPVQSGSNRQSKFDRAQFIAWDGEGFNTDTRIDDYTWDHVFVLLANSLGQRMWTDAGETRLPTARCLDFLLGTARQHPNAIHVFYGGTYDMNHILRSMDRDTVEQLAKFGDCFWQGYYIRFLPRKSLFIRRGDTSITLWDVIGFFQMPFVRAIEEWLGKDYADLPLIREGKANRAVFNDNDRAFMDRYNDAELTALVLLMEQFHGAVKALGLKLSRWDGAGAVAAAIFSKTNFKTHLGKQPKPVETAARYAYFGGRFELGQYGKHEGTVYGYDINSAYPTVFRDMPSLAHGVWRQILNPTMHDISDFSLVHITWKLPGIRFGPFPYRDIQGLVLFPRTGENWVWGIEVKAYFDYLPDRPDWEVELLECWKFVSKSDEKPFTWVQEYYDERQRIVSGDSDLPYGCQMVIKLGLNSLYGKTAQSLGWTEEKQNIPPYHNLCYAGFITASTRAKLWRAAMYAPDDIVMLATDGILSLSELPVDVAEKKILGKWERTVYDYVLAIQSGVYIVRKNGKFIFRKRGIDSSENIESFITKVLKHWGRKKEIVKKLSVPQTRLIGLKSAAVSDDFFKRWGCWYSHPHDLLMQPSPQTKRVPDPSSPNKQPGLELVRTVPTDNVIYDYGSGVSKISNPYARPWDSDISRDDWAWDNPEELAEIIDYEFS